MATHVIIRVHHCGYGDIPRVTVFRVPRHVMASLPDMYSAITARRHRVFVPTREERVLLDAGFAALAAHPDVVKSADGDIHEVHAHLQLSGDVEVIFVNTLSLR